MATDRGIFDLHTGLDVNPKDDALITDQANRSTHIRVIADWDKIGEFPLCTW
jgi:hypothetical protein